MQAQSPKDVISYSLNPVERAQSFERGSHVAGGKPTLGSGWLGLWFPCLHLLSARMTKMTFFFFFSLWLMMNFLPLSRRHRGFRECYGQLPRLDSAQFRSPWSISHIWIFCFSPSRAKSETPDKLEREICWSLSSISLSHPPKHHGLGLPPVEGSIPYSR